MNENASPASGDRLVLAADFGTSGVKIGILNARLELLATATQAYPLSRPFPGAAEQEPENWWSALVAAFESIRASRPELAPRIGALAIAAQMCGLICTDEAAKPLRPAIIWLDKRAAAMTRDLIGGVPTIAGYNIVKMARWLRLANGGPSRNGMDPPSKMIWLREHEPAVWRAAHKLLDVRDWLVARATGRFITTGDCANLTWLMDTRAGREGWSQTLCRHVGIDAERLPEIIDGAAAAGTLTARAATELGLPREVIVIGGCSDVAAAALGSGAVSDGEPHIYAGTSSWVGCFLPGRRVSIVHSYATVAGPTGFRPLLIAAQETCGGALDWLFRAMTSAHGDEDLGSFIAAAAPRTAEDPLFLPWLAGERCPIDDHRLRGAFLGLSLGSGRESFTRSVIDGIALELRWALEAVNRERGMKRTGDLALVGGLARSPVFAQTLADVLGRPVSVAQPLFAGLIGVAALAAPALGWAPDPWESLAARTLADRKIYHPNAGSTAMIALRWREFHAARRALLPWFRRRLAGIENLRTMKP